MPTLAGFGVLDTGPAVGQTGSMTIDVVSPPLNTAFSVEAGRLQQLLADPTRRRIFLLLRQGETCNCELTSQLGLSQNLVSHHMRQFRQAGLVRERRDAADARWIYYMLDPVAIGVAWNGLSAVLDPGSFGVRTPSCGPAAQSCC